MNPEFTVHILNDNGIEKAKAIASVFDSALNELKGHCPEGRAFDIAKTKLEEASFFAKKSMANDSINWRAKEAA